MMDNKMVSSLMNLPVPKNISYFWNFGSLLGICLMLQIFTGLFLSMSYSSHISKAFSSVMKMIMDNSFLSYMQVMHSNGASLFFICVYIHIGRGVYYQSYKFIYTWAIGMVLFFLSMMTAFLGYVLPWGQMSFWGAMVITNLLSTIPYLGNILVIWLWGGFSVDSATLTRFFIFHFLLPFIIVMFVMIHLLFLHNSGSSNPLGIKSSLNKISFFPNFSLKDLVSFFFLFLILSILIFYFPYELSDSDNFIFANSMSTPVHIQPEWYFLFAYAILRSIPNKLGGTVALMFSIIILMIVPIFSSNNFKGVEFYYLNKILFWFFVLNVILLTWIGMSTMSYPYIMIGQCLTVMYYLFFIFNQLIFNYWDKLNF